MTEQQKAIIEKLRSKGYGYKKIAQQLNLSENTVSSYCRRKELNAYGCKNCGETIKGRKGAKPKIFCSDKCRNEWWNQHLNEVNRKANYQLVCAHCGKKFISYGNKSRKYCSRICYFSDRFGKGEQV